MKVTKKTLGDAVKENIISLQQAESLYQFYLVNSQNTAHFSFTHVLYYVGGLIAIGAMTLFMNLGWETFGGAGIFFIALLYAGVGLKLTNNFYSKGFIIPAGIAATFVVCMTPLAIYGLQLWMGLWPDETAYRDYHRYIKWHWIFMELGTLAAGVILAWKYKYPFQIMPIAVTLWYMTMDLSAMLSGGDLTWELRKLVSMYTGLLMIGLAIWVDIRSRREIDYSFWIYIFGVIAFWGGMSFQSSDSELAKFFYFCINVFMIGVGVILVRKVFVVFGALGCCGYISYLASVVFKDSFLFPIVLAGIGLGIIYLGIQWQKHERAITEKTRKMLPEPLQQLLGNAH